MSRWTRTYAPDSAPSMRLFCFPYAGAGASTYRDWRLPERLRAEVWAVQPPGRENRYSEPAFGRLAPLAAAALDAITPLLDRPFAFFGHSMGALVAFEVARAIRRRAGTLPVRLFLSGHRAPDRPPSRGPASGLPDAEFLARLLEMAGAPPSAIRDREVLLALAPLVRADLRACETYVYHPEEPLDVGVTCFAAIDDSEVGVADVACWEAHTASDFQLRTYVGGHLYLRDHAASLLDTIAADLSRVAGGHGTR